MPIPYAVQVNERQFERFVEYLNETHDDVVQIDDETTTSFAVVAVQDGHLVNQILATKQVLIKGDIVTFTLWVYIP